jgi:3-dehydroquinate synthase
MSTVQVMLGERSYPIRIRPGSLGDLGEALVTEFEATRAVAITSKRVAALHYGALATGMTRAHVQLDRLLVPDGERAKTLRVASSVYDRLIELQASRQTVVIGLGGGANCDLAGFVASTFLRGLPLVQVPTTLLAQVDASVGGKTAVNHPLGKNLIGTFYQPRLVWVDPDVLATLWPRERRAGLAEVVKVAAIWDADFFKWLEEELGRPCASSARPCPRVRIARVRDQGRGGGARRREAGLRALLNFGHTLRPAVEVVALTATCATAKRSRWAWCSPRASPAARAPRQRDLRHAREGCSRGLAWRRKSPTFRASARLTCARSRSIRRGRTGSVVRRAARIGRAERG